MGLERFTGVSHWGCATPKILWLTKYTFMVVEESENEFEFGDDTPFGRIVAGFQEISGREQTLTLACIAHGGMPVPAGAYSIFWRAITSSNSVKLLLRNVYDDSWGLPSGLLLSQFLRKSPSLQTLVFCGIDFKEEHCRALAAVQRTDFEVKLHECYVEPDDAEETFMIGFDTTMSLRSFPSAIWTAAFFLLLAGTSP
jgi:hypothetical protein